MKKINTKKTTKQQSVAKVTIPTISIDITDISTDERMINTISLAKLDAGLKLDSNEVMHIVDAAVLATFYACSKVTEMVFNDADLLQCKICKLRCELNWLKRPWYKKLMFWKKKPDCKCICE